MYGIAATRLLGHVSTRCVRVLGASYVCVAAVRGVWVWLLTLHARVFLHVVGDMYGLLLTRFWTHVANRFLHVLGDMWRLYLHVVGAM